MYMLAEYKAHSLCYKISRTSSALQQMDFKKKNPALTDEINKTELSYYFKFAE